MTDSENQNKQEELTKWNKWEPYKQTAGRTVVPWAEMTKLPTMPTTP